MKNLLYILILAFCISSSLVLAAEALPAPQISVAPTQYYPLDEILYLEGRASPNAEVEIFFEQIGDKISPVKVGVEANSNGEWFLSEKIELASGEWMARARTVNKQSVSDWSNPRIIRSIVSGFVFGSVKIKYVPMMLALLSLFLVALALIIYYAFRVRKVSQAALEQEMREKTRELEKKLHDKEQESVKELVEHNFEELRKQIMEELRHLDGKCMKNGKLLPDDEERQEQLLRALRRCEEEIEKKLKDI